MSFRVLVVDDASFMRDTVKRNLRPLIPDAEFFDAPDGRKAMSAVKTKNIQLILSDWEMPEMSGEEFLKWLRSESDYASIPFIMITSRGDRDNVVQAVSAGVSDYMTKPFTPEELQRKVAKQLKRLKYRPPGRNSGVSSGSASSLDVLTGSKKAQVQKPREVRDASAFMGMGAKKAAPAAAPAKKSKFTGKAFVRFAGGTSECDIREMSLQALTGTVPRLDTVPALFEQAAVDLIDPNGEALARVNGYFHGVFAAENRPDSPNIRISIRFVDNDPDKFEALSKAIAGT